MIEITHTADEGAVAHGVPRNGRPAEVLSAIGWCWSDLLDAWHLAESRFQAVSILSADEAAQALEAEGFEVCLRIDDEQRQRRCSHRLIEAQTMHLEGKLSKVDRLLDEHLHTVSPGLRPRWRRTCGRSGCSSDGSTSMTGCGSHARSAGERSEARRRKLRG